MNIIKTSEKILIWMHRNKITINKAAEEIGINRQSFSKKLQDNIFEPKDLITLKRMGFKD